MRRRCWQAAVMPVASAADPCPRQGSRAWRSPPVRERTFATADQGHESHGP
jgi:hypothetical protein